VIVPDTHTWFWWVTDDRRLSSKAKTLLDADYDVRVPAIVCWEIALLVARGRITLDQETSRFLEDALLWDGVALEPLSPRIAVRANSFGDALYRDPADRLIVATAMELGVPLITRDAKIHAFDGVETLW
jgi:PIN domain nuclease of toxin-antitoxin system